MKIPQVLKRILSTTLCGAMLLGIMCVTGVVGTAAAAESLPGIETIKTAGSFHILEIVPSEGKGGVGYYISGQEPDGWKKKAAALTNPKLREDAVRSILTKLTEAGIMSAADDGAPLTGSADYTECYPWNTPLPEKYGTLYLDNPETVFGVPGILTESASGAYNLGSVYELQSGMTGDYAQAIETLSDGAADTGNYYYDLTLGARIPNYSLVQDDTLVAYEAGEGETAQFTLGEKKLILVGVAGAANFPGIDAAKTNYAITVNNVSKERTDTCGFAATGKEFVRVGENKGFFKRNTGALSYVGSGGSYDFTYKDGEKTYTLITSTVFYTGGYVNNEWFKRFVLNYDKSELANCRINFKIHSVPAKSENTITEWAAKSDLVVVSGSFTADTDISELSRTTLYSALLEGSYQIPLWYERDLESCAAPNIKALTSAVAVAKDAPDGKSYVKNKVYGAVTPPILSKDFINQTTGSFDAVSNTIKFQNFLLSKEGKPTLDTTITPAACVRHILGGAVNRAKGAIRVLDIEPSAKTDLSPATIRKWLNETYSNDQNFKIEITTMSSAEFIGSTEDLAETYDAIFIGACLDGMNTTTDSDTKETYTNFNDGNMDKLVYYNIGDTITSGGETFSSKNGYNMSGLLTRDYEDSTVIDATDDVSRTFRYSGNDITSNKLTELKEYIDAGFPVIAENTVSTTLAKIADGTKGNVIFYKGTLDWTKYSLDYYNNIIYYNNNNTLKVTQTNKSGIIIKTTIEAATYEWSYKPKDSTDWIKIATNNSNELSVGNYADGTSFKCYVTVTDLVDKLGDWDPLPEKITRCTPAITPAYTFYRTPNKTYVDNCTNMYEFLKYAGGGTHANFLCKADTENDKELLSNYLLLSKPSISFADITNPKPVEYKMSNEKDGSTMTALTADNAEKIAQQKAAGETPETPVYSLKYFFKINNLSDPSPQQTRYTCRLYSDLDKDGFFEESEALEGVVVKLSDGAGSVNGDAVALSQLRQGEDYFVSCELPSDMVGCISWKLEIVKTSDSGVHTSQTGYTRVKPEKDQAVPLNILQLNTERKKPTLWEIILGWFGITTTADKYPGFDLSTDDDFNALLDIVEKAGDFDVTIYTVGANSVTNLSTVDSSVPGSLAAYRNTLATKLGHTATEQEIFDSFDMLIVGFDDCYQELNEPAAQKVAEFVDSGRPVLFSHDTTSFYSLPSEEFQCEYYGLFGIPTKGNVYSKGYGSWTNISGWWGYHFNTVVRDKVGLDRYGVTSKDFGGIDYKNSDSGYVAQSYSSGGHTLEELSTAGYDVAYKHRSGKTETLPETQGFTNWALLRFEQKNDGFLSWLHDSIFGSDSNTPQASSPTTSIVQNNKGQITTYPFDLNTTSFGGSYDGSYDGTISKTHYQYMQLNMNPRVNADGASDNVIVWYCLSGNEFDVMPKDVVNSYYIYTKGNITYTGFGHTTTGSIPLSEKKLLVNTIIASYRTAKPLSAVRFTDKSGLTEPTSFLVPYDEGVITTSNTAADSSRRIYFTVKNLSGAKDLKFTLGTDSRPEKNSVIETPPTVYAAINDAPANTFAQLESGYTYYVKYDDLNVSGLSPDKSLTLGVFLKSNTEAALITGGDNKNIISSDALTLRVFDLFDLG